MRKTVIIALVGLCATIQSCKDTDYSDGYGDYKKSELEISFQKEFGSIASDQTWNTVSCIETTVIVGEEGSYDIKFFTGNPLNPLEETCLLSEYHINSIESTFWINAPHVTKLYAMLSNKEDEVIHLSTDVEYDKAEFDFTSQQEQQTRAVKLMSRANTGAEDDYKYFSKEEIDAMKKALPEKKAATSLYNNYEFISQGEFIVCPVYGYAWDDDAAGYYYYDPDNEQSTYTEVTLFEHNHELGEKMQYVWEDDSVENFNFGSKTYHWNDIPSDYQYIRTVQYKVDVPKGWRVGFWCYNRDEKVKAYSSISRNEGQKFLSAIVTTETGKTYIGLEDKPTDDMDCNDIVFNVEPVPPVVTPDTVFDRQVYTIAFEDLGTTDDFDFNDIVLYITHNNLTDSVNVQVVAAGGTLPVGVYYDDDLIYEKNSEEMINTQQGDSATVLAEKTYYIRDFDMTDENYYGRFYILLGEETGIRYVVNCNSEPGKAPLALIIAGKWNYPTERTNIADAYPHFRQWVGDTSNATWYMYPTEGKTIKRTY